MSNACLPWEYTHPQIEGCSFAVVVICSYDISGFVPNRNRGICMIEKKTNQRKRLVIHVTYEPITWDAIA